MMGAFDMLPLAAWQGHGNARITTFAQRVCVSTNYYMQSPATNISTNLRQVRKNDNQKLSKSPHPEVLQRRIQ